MRKWLIAGIVLVVAFAGSGLVLLRPTENTARAQLITSDLRDVEGFSRAEGPIQFDFPRDHGPHPDYQTEWWYYTGNLTGDDGQRFGYQLTFFRRALTPIVGRQERESVWATEQIYMGHFALTDTVDNDFYAFERFSRGAAGLAGAESLPYRVWLEGWSVEEIAPDTYHLQASEAGIALDLILVSRKEPVQQGDRGYSQKGPEPGNASYYYSLTRLETTGTITIDGTVLSVGGNSWMDHEYSTSALSGEQIGWDWFSVALNDGTDVMFYQIRRADGSIDPYSKGTISLPDGTSQRLFYGESDTIITIEETWRSPHTGAEYPARWRVEIPDHGLDLLITPVIPDQELTLSFQYWEGAVDVSGTQNGEPVSGAGYVELTGYAQSLQGQF